MSNVKQFNNISEELREKVKAAMPKKGQKIVFVSLRPSSRGSTVLPFDTIWDPNAGEDGEGAMIDIVCVTGAQPQLGSINGVLSPEPKNIRNLDRIQFSKRTDANRIIITGGDRRSEARFEFLFLTNQNRNNVKSEEDPSKGNEWYVARTGRPSIFYMQEPDKTAKQQLEHSRLVRQAGELIDSMPESKLRDFALGLDMKGITQFTTPDEIRVKLLNMATANPTKIMQLDKDEVLKAKILVKEAEKLGVISFNAALSQYEWPETGDTICVVPPANKGIEVICSYLLDKRGIKTRQTIETLVESKKKSKKGK